MLYAQPLLLVLVWYLPQDVLLCKTANHKAPCSPGQQDHLTSNASCCSLPINWLHCLFVTQNVQLVGANSTTAGINISAAGYIWRDARRLSLQQAISDVKNEACLCSRLYLTWRLTPVSAACCMWRDACLCSRTNLIRMWLEVKTAGNEKTRDVATVISKKCDRNREGRGRHKERPLVTWNGPRPLLYAITTASHNTLNSLTW